MKRVAITGGIGSGKSTVCRALSAVSGAPVYDSDRRAKEIMNDNLSLREAIVALLGPEAYDGTTGELNRPYVASRIFGHGEMLERLNGLVHPRVVEDFELWAESQSGEYVILESALLFTSPLVGHYDLAVVVDAPVEMRIERCLRRDGGSREGIERRMAGQMAAEEMRSRADVVVEADGRDLSESLREIDSLIRRM